MGVVDSSGEFGRETGREHERDNPFMAPAAASSTGKRTLTEGLSRGSESAGTPAGRGGVELPDGLRGAGQREREREAAPGDGSFGAETSASVGGSSAGGLRVSPIRFASIPVGDSSEQRLELENEAARPVRIVNWTVEGEDAGDFEVRLPRLFDLSTGGRFWGAVRFRPSAEGQRTARLAIQSDLPEVTTTIELRGQSSAAPAAKPAVTTRSKIAGAEAPGRGPAPPRVVEGSHVASIRPPGGQEPAALPAGGRVDDMPFPDAIALADRQELIRETGNNLTFAAIAFKGACDHVKASEAAKAKASGDVMATLAEVAFGLLVPGLGRIAESYSKRLVTSYLDAAVKGFLADRDLVKATFTGVTKVGAQVLIKQRSKALFGDTEISHLLDLMSQSSMAAFQAVIRDLDRLAFPKVLSLWAAYHESVTTQGSFEGVLVPFVEGYQRFVSPIGKPRPGENYPYEMQLRAMWLTKAGGKRLAFVRRDAAGYTFGGWIPETVAQHAMEKTSRMFGSVSFLREDVVQEVP